MSELGINNVTEWIHSLSHQQGSGVFSEAQPQHGDTYMKPQFSAVVGHLHPPVTAVWSTLMAPASCRKSQSSNHFEHFRDAEHKSEVTQHDHTNKSFLGFDSCHCAALLGKSSGKLMHWLVCRLTKALKKKMGRTCATFAVPDISIQNDLSAPSPLKEPSDLNHLHSHQLSNQTKQSLDDDTLNHPVSIRAMQKGLR